MDSSSTHQFVVFSRTSQEAIGRLKLVTAAEPVRCRSYRSIALSLYRSITPIAPIAPVLLYRSIAVSLYRSHRSIALSLYRSIAPIAPAVCLMPACAAGDRQRVRDSALLSLRGAPLSKHCSSSRLVRRRQLVGRAPAARGHAAAFGWSGLRPAAAAAQRASSRGGRHRPRGGALGARQQKPARLASPDGSARTMQT